MRIAVNALFFLIVPFIFAGIIPRVKAFWAGRKGQPLLQPFYDFVKGLKKGRVISRTTGLVFNLSPVISLSAIIFAALLVPLYRGLAVISFEGDFVVFAYLLALAKFVSSIAALETGSSFEGMGTSREVTFTAFVEPAFFIVLGSLAALSRRSSFAGIFLFFHQGGTVALLSAVLCFAAFMIMLLTEGSRVPVDDPTTHLELTMIHEVMALDNSGPDLSLINYASYLKMTLISLLAGLAFSGVGPVVSVVGACVSAGACAFLTGVLESSMARVRMTHVPQFVFVMVSLGLILLAVAILFICGGIV
jgi:formate hydrogenlyase subunit 4